MPSLAAVAELAGAPAVVLADSGFYSEEAGRQIEKTPAGAPTGTTVYAAWEKTNHHRTVADLEGARRASGTAGPRRHQRTNAPPVENHGRKEPLQAPPADRRAGLRHHQIDPGLPPVPAAGLDQVSTQWTLVCLAYNLRRLHVLGAGKKLAAAS